MSTEPIEIEKLEVSSRLKNCMRRSGVSDLRDIAGIPRESIVRIRNMGDATYKELQSLMKIQLMLCGNISRNMTKFWRCYRKQKYGTM